jgi:D-inositol-3-phosphate glycosyltransferase
MNVYTLNLANSLAELGCSVDFYTRTHHENDEKIITTHNNVRIIHLTSSNKNLYQDSQSFALKVHKFIKREKLSYDLMHAHYFYSGLVGLFLKKTTGMPLFMTFHTLSAMKEKYGKVVDNTRQAAENEIIKYSDAIVASTGFEKRDLIVSYHADKSKIFVVHPGVNHEIFKPYHKLFSRRKLHLPIKPKIILYVGRIDPLKGIRFLIQAVACMVKTQPQFEEKFRILIIGGDVTGHNFWKNEEVQKIQKLITHENLSCCVTFAGSKPHDELPYYYSGSDVVVMPSVYESFGLVVLEAMACGSAVVATRVGGLKLLINDKINGRLFKSGDNDDFCNILWELLNNSEERNRLGRSAVISSQQYCWSKQAEKMLKVYRKLL